MPNSTAVELWGTTLISASLLLPGESSHQGGTFLSHLEGSSSGLWIFFLFVGPLLSSSGLILSTKIENSGLVGPASPSPARPAFMLYLITEYLEFII